MTHLYIRCPDPASLAKIREHYPKAYIESPSQFACSVIEPGDRFTPSEGQFRSQELGTEIIYLAFSSTTDSFQFTHCIEGKTQRHLQYGMYVEQGIWEEVTGNPEPWETSAFFPPTSMEILADYSSTDPNYERISEIYGQRVIRAMESYPMIDARESARASAVYYRLTDWLNDWNGSSQATVTDTPHVFIKQVPNKPWWCFWR